MRLEIELQVIGDEQVELAIVVVVDERAAGVVADAILREVQLRRDIFEALAAGIAIEDVLPPVSDEEIGEAIVVVIARADALAPAGVRQAQRLGGTRETCRRLRCGTCGSARPGPETTKISSSRRCRSR